MHNTSRCRRSSPSRARNRRTLFSSIICSLNDRNIPTVPDPDTTSEIQMLPDFPSSPRDMEGLSGTPARDGPSPFPVWRVPLDDFTALIKYFSKNSDWNLAHHDSLEIAESKGFFFPPPKRWRPGGYKRCHRR